MIATLLDPSLFVCPSIEEGEEAFDGFLETIYLLFVLQRAKWTKVMISAGTCGALAEVDQYPIAPVIQSSLAHFDRSDIQLKDIMGLIGRVLQKTPSAESFYGIDSLLAAEVEIVPRDIATGHAPPLRICLEDLLSTVFTGETIGSSFSIISVVGRVPSAVGNEAGFRGLIHEVDPPRVISLPMMVHGEFRYGICRLSIVESISCEQIWRFCSTSDDYSFLIDALIKLHCKDEGSSAIAWKFGPRFLESVVLHDFGNNLTKIRTLLRCCAETICGTNLPATHALREDSGGGAKQQTRGKDKAWRRDICYEYHLHYWAGESGVELASVVVHNDFTIPR